MTPDDIQEFLESLDRYGARLEDWPDAPRQLAHALLAVSAEARLQLDAMRRAEHALAATRAVVGTAADAIRLHAMREAQVRPQRRTTQRLSWAVAASVALIAGVYVGTMSWSTESPADIVTAALDQTGGFDVR